jgi:VWFA-related protein
MSSVRLAALLCALGIGVAGQTQMRRVYVSALDGNGASVEDLTAEDFAVKEGGKARTIVRAEPASAKMQIAILVDDNGTGLFRVGVARFIEALLGRAEFSISTVTGQTLKLVDYTTDTRELSEAVGKLGPRPATNDGNQLLDGITGSARDMAKRKASRPVILALTVGGDDVTPMEPDDALDDLRRGGAALYVVSVLNSAMRQTSTPTRPAEMISEGHALSAVLGDGPKRSGGYREEISAIAGVDLRLQRLADQLKRQYVIEYSFDGAKPSDRISITTRRRDVTLRAPTHVPNKF